MTNLIPVYEELITNLSENKFAITSLLFDKILLEELLNTALENIHQNKLHPAGIGNQHTLLVNNTIRGDKIMWIDSSSANIHEQEFLNKINHFSDYLNETCYTGIAKAEFHYACYEPGTFYKKHIDRFKNDNARKFSVITYLNKNWKADDGGELIIYHPDKTITVNPEFGKTVIFKSDELAHEVLPNKKQRLSITGWLK